MMNMKSALLSVCAGAAAIAAAPAAIAQDLQGGTYFSFAGGGHMPRNSSVV